MSNWIPVSESDPPLNTCVLLWWTPIPDNDLAEAAVIGQFSTYEPGKWWNPQTAEYQDVAHIKYWMPLPEPPND